MSLLDVVQQHLGPTQVQQISQQLGVSPGVAQSAIAAAVPMLLGGMARHANSAPGAETIQTAMQNHADVVNEVDRMLQAGPLADASGVGGLLGRILGEHRQPVEQGVEQASGLDSEKTKKLLFMLSPIVLGVLARREFGGQKATQATPQQLATELHREAQTTKQVPQVGRLLGAILGAVESPGS